MSHPISLGSSPILTSVAGLQNADCRDPLAFAATDSLVPPPAPLAMPMQHVRTVGGLAERLAEIPSRLLALCGIKRSLPKP